MSNISSQSVREWLRAAANSFISQNYHHSRQQPLCQILWKKLFCLTFLKTNRETKHPKEQEKVPNERKWGALTSIMRFAAVATLDWQNIYSSWKMPHHLFCTNVFTVDFILIEVPLAQLHVGGSKLLSLHISLLVVSQKCYTCNLYRICWQYQAGWSKWGDV